MATKSKKKPKAPKKEFKRERMDFKQLEKLLSARCYVGIASFLYHNDYNNPTRFEIYAEYDHSFRPTKPSHSFSAIAKFWIIETWYRMEKIKEDEKEAKRLEAARRRRRR